MKLKIFVTPQKQVVHPASQTVGRALRQMGYPVSDLVLGKYFEIELENGADPEAAIAAIRKVADPAIFNGNIEEYRIEVTG